MSQIFYQSNILVCGSARVGKTTLINAICQRELAKSSGSLNANTKTIQRYAAQSVVGNAVHEAVFWDTPGIDSWDENESRSYMGSLLEHTNPLCMIYCASPGSFAKLDHVSWMVSECHRRKIFCALVCTNMWAGRSRQEVVDSFCQLLKTLHPEIHPSTEDGVIYFDRLALVTMVNSAPYVDADFDVSKPASGVNELIFGIAKCLERDFMLAWFRTVSENRSFWTNMSSKIGNLLKMPYEKLNSLYECTEKFLYFLFFDLSGFGYQDSTVLFHTGAATEKTDPNEQLFYDAEIIDMPISSKQNQLVFTMKSKDMSAQFYEALTQLGATKIRNNSTNANEGDEFSLRFIVAFQDEEHMKAVYSLCQVMNQTTVSCTEFNDDS